MTILDRTQAGYN